MAKLVTIFSDDTAKWLANLLVLQNREQAKQTGRRTRAHLALAHVQQHSAAKPTIPK